MRVRPPAVARLFHSDNPDELRRNLRNLLDTASVSDEPCPKAIIVPHAAYAYSGPVAASAYARVAAGVKSIRRVVLLGPAHRKRMHAIAASGAEAFATPLGLVTVDRDALDSLLTEKLVSVDDGAHAREHSLEVHLPFLQTVLAEFTIVPLLVGHVTAQNVEQVLRRVWDGPETLIVVSSDLSHYHPYEVCQQVDGETAQAIEALRVESITAQKACGFRAIRGLLHLAAQKKLDGRVVDLRNSGDTSKQYDSVVGYIACVFQ